MTWTFAYQLAPITLSTICQQQAPTSPIETICQTSKWLLCCCALVEAASRYARAKAVDADIYQSTTHNLNVTWFSPTAEEAGLVRYKTQRWLEPAEQNELTRLRKESETRCGETAMSTWEAGRRCAGWLASTVATTSVLLREKKGLQPWDKGTCARESSIGCRGVCRCGRGSDRGVG